VTRGFCRSLHLEVGIEIRCNAQFAVSKELTHFHELDASGDQEARRGVPKVMKATPFELRLGSIKKSV
jgi:hypothetical protein